MSVDISDEERIDAAHPLKTGRHDLYAYAMKLVGARHAKGDLVDLVNWLLYERAELLAKNGAKPCIVEGCTDDNAGEYALCPTHLDAVVRRESAPKPSHEDPHDIAGMTARARNFWDREVACQGGPYGNTGREVLVELVVKCFRDGIMVGEQRRERASDPAHDALVTEALDMLEEVMAWDPSMPTAADTMLRAEELLAKHGRST